MDSFDFLSSALELSTNAIAYKVSERLAAEFPDLAILEGPTTYFDVEAYEAAGLCRIHPREAPHGQFASSWDEEQGVLARARNAWLDVEWRGQRFGVLLMTWSSGFCDERYAWILADERKSAEEFFSEVSAWNAEIREEVLVFDGGSWNKSETLFRSIQSATFDNLVLGGTLKEEIRDDLARFFGMKEVYEAHGVPWKRGILFIGPPGNGKTHAVKALVNSLRVPCLYAKSFKSEHITEHDCIRSVFGRARKAAPCVLVLEDLDSLINDQNRSFFLNELDGFAANTGVLTLATTNHPDRLDPAILDRPSRFDRKYHFPLPAKPERIAFSRLWANSLKDALKPTDHGLFALTDTTEGFSFAYMKELFVTSLMAWMAKPGALSMDAVLLDQAALLRSQMSSAKHEDVT